MKSADQLSPADLNAHKVWEFVTDMEAESSGETYVTPIDKLPVDSLNNRLVSTLLTLANGTKVLAILGSVDLSNAKSTQHFLTVTVFNMEQSFHLARYHDVDHARHDAKAFAAFLGLAVEAVFPMYYDISNVAVGLSDCVNRSILAAPTERLSREQLIELALK